MHVYESRFHLADFNQEVRTPYWAKKELNLDQFFGKLDYFIGETKEPKFLSVTLNGGQVSCLNRIMSRDFYINVKI